MDSAAAALNSSSALNATDSCRPNRRGVYTAMREYARSVIHSLTRAHAFAISVDGKTIISKGLQSLLSPKRVVKKMSMRLV